jgi:hypothetical protein
MWYPLVSLFRDLDVATSLVSSLLHLGFPSPMASPTRDRRLCYKRETKVNDERSRVRGFTNFPFLLLVCVFNASSSSLPCIA